jgi:hypothetical protein
MAPALLHLSGCLRADGNAAREPCSLGAIPLSTFDREPELVRPARFSSDHWQINKDVGALERERAESRSEDDNGSMIERRVIARNLFEGFDRTAYEAWRDSAIEEARQEGFATLILPLPKGGVERIDLRSH